MEATISPVKDCANNIEGVVSGNGHANSPVDVAFLTGGTDRHYVYGLATALVSKKVRLDVIGSDEVDRPEMHTTPNLNFLNLKGDYQPTFSFQQKLSSLVLYYARLIAYAWTTRRKIFHILWNNKFEFFDRTVLMLYYKLLGKKVALTAHNINARKRDQNDSLLNRLTLKIQYRLADHIFVHTQKMKDELHEDFGVAQESATVITFGMNKGVLQTNLTCSEARRLLGIKKDERTILFFGNVRPYKGLEYLVAAFQQIMNNGVPYRLIVAGRWVTDYEEYYRELRQTVEHFVDQGRATLKTGEIPDEEAEIYLKAADVLALPYTEIFQSGVLFLGYSFGLPVIATEVGAFREDIVEGKTGFLCNPCDANDMARAIETYFESDLFKSLGDRRKEIRAYAEERYSWDLVAEKTRGVYAKMSGKN